MDKYFVIMVAAAILGGYAAIAYTGAKKSDCRMEAIKAGASKEIIELCDRN